MTRCVLMILLSITHILLTIDVYSVNMNKTGMVSLAVRFIGTNDYISQPESTRRVQIGGSITFLGKGSPDCYDGEWATFSRVGPDEWSFDGCSGLTRTEYIPKDSEIGRNYNIVAVRESAENAHSFASAFGLTVMRTVVTKVSECGMSRDEHDVSVYLVLGKK